MGSIGHVITIGDVVMGDLTDSPFVITKVKGLGKPETQGTWVQRPREDGENRGKSQLKGRTLTVAGYVNARNGNDARALFELLVDTWDAAAIRPRSGEYLPLTISAFGSPVHTLWGEPIDCDPTDDGFDAADQGRIDFVCTFKALDHLLYGPREVVPVPFLVVGRAGITWPVKWPVVWSSRDVSSRPGQISVGGRAEAWPVITIHGPILRPRVTVVGQWFIELDMSLPADRSVTIDTTRWNRGITLDDGSGAGGYRTPASRWPRYATLPPGPLEVVLSGTDPTNTASMDFAWFTARRSL